VSAIPAARRIRRVLLPLAVGLLVLAGCGTESSGADGVGASADDGEPQGALVVAAKLPPIADLVADVLDERGRVESLIPQGADAHTHELRPSDVRRLTEASAFFGVGLGLNASALRLAEENLPDGAPVVPLAEQALDAGDLTFEGFGHSHGEEPSHSHGEPGHSHGEAEAPAAVNPHVWLDPGNVMDMVGVIRDELVALDPGGEEAYRANAAALLDRIEALDEAIVAAAATVAPDDRKLVVYHDAWAYFGRRYGFEVVAALQPADLSEPSAREVRRIIDQIDREGVPAVFGSAEFPSDVLESIAAATGADYGVPLSDDQLPGSPGDPEHSYVGLMQRNAAAIVAGLGGDTGALDALGART
jgi:ABC-type Zn uptake system ZnuABC Zn-binding protein ZnuA